MNIKTAPFDNNDVRLALKYAIDREEILKKILLGHGTVGNDNPIAKSIKYAIDPKPVYSYDPEKARFHVKKAGLSTLKVDLSVADAAFPGAIDAGVLYKAQAAKAGIDINVVREPNDGYWDNVWQHKPWSACYWNGRATCDWMFSTAFTPNAAWNDTKWDNPRFTQLMVAARAETDDKKRAAMYAEMQQLVHDQSGDIVLAFNNYVNAHSKKVAHGQVGHLWDDDGNKIAERWWSA
jgi:peptide/nickel transport system substrate-binding protein